ncbi:SDR family oxidoreductase sniffer isoform X2 [Rhodnius prolixus]|uniref:Short-chain dehydrogenase n=1 Tax=Rhodnius prolixus TaxID=13249 RepID=T1HQI1_RHOPR
MKSILITGSNRGIGLGLVKALIKNRTIPKHIIATCRQPNQAKELQNLAESNKNIHILQLDLLNFDSYAEFSKIVATIVKNDGLNVLINNAGVGHKFVRIGQVKTEPLIDSFFINCVAPIMMSKEMLPFLKQAAESNSELPIGVERAAIINISSSLASIADNNDGGYYAYRCSKAALNAATKSLSIDVKPYNILANCLHPGWVKTRMGGNKAPLEVDDACSQIINTIQNFSNENTGRFYSYNGEELKW